MRSGSSLRTDRPQRHYQMSQAIQKIVSLYTPNTVATLWTIGQRIVLPAWILLVTVPQSSITRQFVKLGVAVNAFFYVALLPALFFDPRGNLSVPDFGSWNGIMHVFKTGSQGGLLAAWVHYLAFDLYIGWLIAQDGVSNRIPRVIMVLPILATLMAGPTGLAIHLIVRGIFGARTSFLPWN